MCIFSKSNYPYFPSSQKIFLDALMLGLQSSPMFGQVTIFRTFLVMVPGVNFIKVGHSAQIIEISSIHLRSTHVKTFQTLGTWHNTVYEIDPWSDSVIFFGHLDNPLIYQTSKNVRFS